MSSWRLVITGCGTSHGNPPFGFPDLWSENPKDHRRRSGGAILGPDDEVILLDTGPDLLHQMRDPFKDWDGRSYPQKCLSRCDGVLMTHDHADHSHGLNDLRHINRLMGAVGISVYGQATHLKELRRMFPYAFGGGQSAYTMGNPDLQVVEIEPKSPFEVGGLKVECFPFSHGPAGMVTGYMIGDGALCYITDCKELDPTWDEFLRGSEVLIINALMDKSHPTHMNYEESLAVIERLQPKRAVLTHLGYSVFHDEWTRRLEAAGLGGRISVAYDGMVVPFLPQTHPQTHPQTEAL